MPAKSREILPAKWISNQFPTSTTRDVPKFKMIDRKKLEFLNITDDEDNHKDAFFLLKGRMGISNLRTVKRDVEGKTEYLIYGSWTEIK